MLAEVNDMIVVATKFGKEEEEEEEMDVTSVPSWLSSHFLMVHREAQICGLFL